LRRISILSGQKSKEIGRYFGIKGPEVSEVIKVIEGRLSEEIKLIREIEYHRQKW
jgi:hypothetical protein